MLCGTAGVPIGRFFDAVSAGLDHSSPYVRSFVWKLKDAKWISKDAIESARMLLPPTQFEAEYEGKWASSADSMFPLELLRRQSVDVEVPDLASLTGPAALLGGVDWGATTDRSAVMAIARIPLSKWNASIDPSYPMFLAWPLRHFAPGTQLSACVDEIVACEAPWFSLTVETVGLGQMPAQEVARRVRRRVDGRQSAAGGDWAWLDVEAATVTPVHTSADHKTAAYGTLRALLERGQLLLANDGDLQRELASLRVELRANGVSLNAAGGAHDDLADALALAALPYRSHNGAMRVRLADFAGDALPEPARLPSIGRDVDLVTTPGGINVPRAPWLQSPASADVTPPRAARAQPIVPSEPTLFERSKQRVQTLPNER